MLQAAASVNTDGCTANSCRPARNSPGNDQTTGAAQSNAHRDDELVAVLGALRDADGGDDGSARGNAHQQPLLLGQPPRHVHRLLAGHLRTGFNHRINIQVGSMQGAEGGHKGEECAGRVQCSTTAFCSQWWPCKICRLWLAALAYAQAEQGTRRACSAKCRMQSWPQPKRTFRISSISETSRMPGTKPADQWRTVEGRIHGTKRDGTRCRRCEKVCN